MQIDDGVGISITILTTGNFVAHFPSWDSANAADVGAVILCSGITGCNGQITAQNSLTGTSTTDTVGKSSSTAHTNGDYVVRSRSWDNAGIADVGAVTYCSGTVGCVGTVSTANSLFGANAGDKLGISKGGSVEATTGVIPLTNGNYVVVNWKADGERGAVSFGYSVTGTIGVVSPSNSLMGANAGPVLLP